MRTPWTLLQTAIASLALAAGIIGVGSVRAPVARTEGQALGVNLTPIGDPARAIRIAAFNIHSGRNAKGQTDLSLTAKTAKGFDLVGLEEVYNPIEPGTPPQVAQLAASSQPAQPARAWLFAPTERQYWGDRFGNGLLTSIPIDSWETVPLPAPKEGSRRNAIIAHSGPVTFIITHITRSSDQDEQLHFVTDLFLNQPAPVVLMGDLNATSKHPVLQDLLDQPGIHSPLDEKLPDHQGKHIDWIITRGLDTRDAGFRDLGASDHPLVWAELAISPPATQPTTEPANPDE